VQPRQHDPHAETIVLPSDELAARRARKTVSPRPDFRRTEPAQADTPQTLTVEQVQRLLVAAELRKRANQGE
jgi:hypothetical protein